MKHLLLLYMEDAMINPISQEAKRNSYIYLCLARAADNGDSPPRNLSLDSQNHKLPIFKLFNINRV